MLRVAVELFVPGRLCLFGEHSDWAGAWRSRDPRIHPGHCLVAGTDAGIRSAAEAAEGCFEFEARFGDSSLAPVRARIPLDKLPSVAASRAFESYAAAALLELVEVRGIPGLRLEATADLPVNRGLSSSAAICVSVIRAANRVYGLELEVEEEMDFAWRGERRTGSQCGRMDQICALGRRTTLLRFDGDRMGIEEVACGGRFFLLVVDLRAGKDTRRILADLNACFPDAPGPLAAAVRGALGPTGERLVCAARVALERGDAPALGALMDEAQAVFDRDVAPACPELEAPRLHRVLAHPAVRELGYGGKGVGSQGDGCAQIVARGADEREALARRLEADLGVRCLAVTLEPGGRAVPAPEAGGPATAAGGPGGSPTS